ncbi:MAG: HAD family phosphatase [Ignavibacteria bacterium]
MNNKISVIVFDLGNVLIPFDYDIIKNKLNNVDEGLGERFYNKYKNNYHIHREFEKWELSNEEFLKIMTDWTENKVTKEEFCKIYSEIFIVNEDVVSLLPKLKPSYKLVLLSNTNYIHQKYGWEKYDFFKHFNKLILSHEVGAVKPEEKIYRAVEEFTNLPSEEHIFIDDVKEYAEGAKKCGWDAINFVGYQNLIEELKTRNIL